MERLSKAAPSVKLTAQQKKDIAELESKCAAKIAEREIGLKGEIAQAAAKGDPQTMDRLERQLVSERKALQAELEAKKETVRRGGRAK